VARGLSANTSIAMFEGDGGRKLHAVRKYELAVIVDEAGSPSGYRQRGVRTRLVGPGAASVSVEIGTLEVICRPGVGVHADPLRGDVVDEQEARAHRGKDRQEADELLLGNAAADMVQSALGDGAATIVGEVAQRAQRRLHAAPHQPLVDG